MAAHTERTTSNKAGIVTALCLASALALSSMPLHGQATFLGFSRYCPVPVVEGRTPLEAEATFMNGSPVVLVDPSIRDRSISYQEFALAHECGHHVRGHVTLRGTSVRRLPGGIYGQELEADCWAGAALSRNGFDLVIEDMLAFWYPRPPGGPGYPPGSTRADEIGRCAGWTDGVVYGPDAGPDPVGYPDSPYQYTGFMEGIGYRVSVAEVGPHGQRLLIGSMDFGGATTIEFGGGIPGGGRTLSTGMYVGGTFSFDIWQRAGLYGDRQRYRLPHPSVAFGAFSGDDLDGFAYGAGIVWRLGDLLLGFDLLRAPLDVRVPGLGIWDRPDVIRRVTIGWIN